MNKDSIYKLIGYNGEYNKEIKNKIRNLLKKYHPDRNHGDDKTFKLVNEVKKEIENNSKIKYQSDTTVKKEPKSNEDYQYYQLQINELSIKKEKMEQAISKQEKIINDFLNHYNKINEQFNKNQEMLCQNNDNINYLKKFKKRYIFYILFFLLFIILYFSSKKPIFIINTIFIIILLSGDVFLLYLTIQKVSSNSNQYFIKNNLFLKELEELKEKINLAKQEILNSKRELVKINNDIRFYQNRIK